MKSKKTSFFSQPKKIQIISCSHTYYWYVNSIGEVFEIMGEEEKNYIVLEPPLNSAGIRRLVKKSDAKIL